MTERKAYDSILNMSKCSMFPSLADIYKTALDALNCRIEKKVIKIGDICGECPVCKSIIAKDSKYCRFCGQALDWSSENE